MLAVLWALAAGCELYDPSFFSGDGGQFPGKTCYEDTDCAPNGCCGMGTEIVHVDDAPNCSTTQCMGNCPVSGIKCGCGVPVCRSNRCTSAISSSPDCD